ncbi:MAG: hypothetical protein OK438_04700 [Thaumarchaeota archaeon]|nr:hypothetical protein [Nitrososphaerota archaeon]
MEKVALLGQVEGKGSRHDNFVFNPFYKWVADLFPAETGVRMRQFRYLMNYANILTMMNADRRARIIIRGQARALITHYEDIDTAARLILSEIAAPVPRFKVDFYRKYVVPCFEGNITINAKLSMKTGTELKFEGEEPVTVRQIQEYCKDKGKNVGRSWLIKTILEPLEDAGYLEVGTDQVDKRRNVYKPLHGAQNSEIFMESRYPDYGQVRESLESFQKEFQNTDQEMAFILADGTLVDDLQKIVDALMKSYPSFRNNC